MKSGKKKKRRNENTKRKYYEFSKTLLKFSLKIFKQMKEKFNNFEIFKDTPIENICIDLKMIP